MKLNRVKVNCYRCLRCKRMVSVKQIKQGSCVCGGLKLQGASPNLLETMVIYIKVLFGMAV